MATGGFFDDSFLGDILEEVPRAGFFAQAPRFGQSPLQRNFFSNRFDQIYDQYLGSLGQQLQAGQQPTLRFTDFINAFDFNREFNSLPPQLRGDFGQQRIAPRTRQLFF